MTGGDQSPVASSAAATGGVKYRICLVQALSAMSVTTVKSRTVTGMLNVSATRLTGQVCWWLGDR
jgi:hypothetical protein